MPDETMVGRHRAVTRENQERPEANFRVDVEGLRAVAVGLVILYHAGLSFLPGGFVGVDVFFVISGFLITTQLVSELRRTGRISLLSFYARRAKRLLPAAGVVLAATAGLVYFFLPRSSWANNGGDIIGAALYMVNWRLADQAVDYLAEGEPPSAVQHFWSLAVEEQYYLVWPLLIILAVAIARATRAKRSLVLAASLGALVLASFVWSIVATADSPQRAFFATTTRVWELGVGAAVALAAGACARLPQRVAAVISWLGLAAVATAGLLISTETAWPSYAAALPTLGAAAVIAGGFASGPRGAVVLLGISAVRWVGALSYSLYLWHWPLIVAATNHWGADATTGRLLVIGGLSVIPAWLTYRFVENPFRYAAAISRSPRLALSTGANFTMVGVAAGLALLAFVGLMPVEQRPEAQGARILASRPRDDPKGAPLNRVEWMTPEPARARRDLTVAHGDDCLQGIDNPEVIVCEYGDKGGDTTVALAGDSKMMQWIPALVPLAEQNGWRVVTYFESGCPFALVTTHVSGKARLGCRTWVDRVMDRLRADPPDWLITSQLHGRALDETTGTVTADAMVNGLRRAWSALTPLDVKVVVVADNPGPGGNAYECLEKHPQRMSACAFDRDTAKSAAAMQHRAVQGQEGVTIVDLNDAVCPTKRCAPVIGNVLVYRDASHITGTYVRTLTPRMAEALAKAGMPVELAKVS